MDDTTGLATIDERSVDAQTMEQVMLAGDLSKLSTAKRLEYYGAVCRSLGLNPLTQPFSYITFQGKMRLYALRDCTDQLRRLHNVSVEIVKRDKIGEIYVVTARASMPNGRFDESTGAVFLGTKSGEDLANLYMRSETKAKRRSTLSICGLGWLDETEADTLPRIERPATREPQPSHPEPDHTPEDPDIQGFLLDQIMTTLKSIAPGASAADREHRLHLLSEAFGVTGWSKLKGLPVSQLQAGYAHLQELVMPDEDILDAEPMDDDDVPLSEPPQEASGDTHASEGSMVSTEPADVTTEAGSTSGVDDGHGYATDEQLDELLALATQVGDDAVSDTQKTITNHKRQMEMGVYTSIESYLRKRLKATKA